MAPLKVGDKLPEGVKFTWAPILEEDPTVCGRPQEFDANKEFAGKKVVLVSVPGAFTPGCQAFHVPPYIQKLDELKTKGVDAVAIIAFNDAFVMNAWGKVNKAKEPVYFLSDDKTQFSKNYGRRDGTISYSENEPNPGQVTVSGADAILAKL
ncbi:putative tsa family protein [Diplodia seriata]|uniref:Putative tsa family protein n=1 Tax=Diplodia seriata TaxID=420778 RepID=A0A0G2DUT0_9PEZI|nr:putative tsa family protein [Diplodia seriata]